jgi:hypothetical protein
MTKARKVTIELPNEEEFNKFSDAEIEEHMLDLETVNSFEELMELLESMGVNLIEDEEFDDEPAGPGDTVH